MGVRNEYRMATLLIHTWHKAQTHALTHKRALRRNYNKCFSHSTIRRRPFKPTTTCRASTFQMMMTTTEMTTMTMESTERTPNKFPMSMHLVVCVFFFFPFCCSCYCCWPPMPLHGRCFTIYIYFKHDRDPVAILCK